MTLYFHLLAKSLLCRELRAISSHCSVYDLVKPRFSAMRYAHDITKQVFSRKTVLAMKQPHDHQTEHQEAWTAEPHAEIKAMMPLTWI